MVGTKLSHGGNVLVPAWDFFYFVVFAIPSFSKKRNLKDLLFWGKTRKIIIGINSKKDVQPITDCTSFLCNYFEFTSPPQMRHSLIYNYLRELGVLMSQNA